MDNTVNINMGILQATLGQSSLALVVSQSRISELEAQLTALTAELQKLRADPVIKEP